MPAEKFITARDIERLARQCTVEHIPTAQVPLYRLEKIGTLLTSRGWDISIVNQGTVHVYWRAMLKGTCQRVCRVCHLSPV